LRSKKINKLFGHRHLLVHPPAPSAAEEDDDEEEEEHCQDEGNAEEQHGLALCNKVSVNNGFGIVIVMLLTGPGGLAPIGVLVPATAAGPVLRISAAAGCHHRGSIAGENVAEDVHGQENNN
jgi:hypothetical protein